MLIIIIIIIIIIIPFLYFQAYQAGISIKNDEASSRYGCIKIIFSDWTTCILKYTKVRRT